MLSQAGTSFRGQPHEVRSDQSFDGGGNLLTYCDPLYTQDAATSATHHYLAEIKNSWNWKVFGQWTSRILVKNDYSYDNVGNRPSNQVSDNNGIIRTEGYGYDELSRLTSVNYGDGQTQVYSFDPMGNRLSKNDSLAGNEAYTYNNANMLLTRAGQSYTNDNNGNTQTGGGRSNTWDGQNRLTQCVFNGTTSTFVYGADGLRRRETTGGTTTNYVLDGDMSVRTLVGGAVDQTFLTGPRGTEYQRIGANALVW